MSETKRILVINTGSTSSKVALYENETAVITENIKADPEVCRNSVRCMQQLPERRRNIQDFIERNKIDMTTIDMISCRGGNTGPYEGGAYLVNELMVNYAKYAATSNHPSAISCVLGFELGEKYGIPSIIYDGVHVDEMAPIAQVTGIPGIKINTGSHVLNPRAVARAVAKKQGRKLEDCRFIVAHLGGGISITAILGGKLVDYDNEYLGPMSPERAGILPSVPLAKLCYSGKYTLDEMLKLISGRGGFAAHLGTTDALDVENRALAGEEKPKFLYDAMCYQLSKKIAEMSAVFCGKVDNIIFTGSLARSQYIIDYCKERVGHIAPFEVIPGEMEMDALAGGAYRVLTGEEEAKPFHILPAGYATEEEFNAFVAAQPAL